VFDLDGTLTDPFDGITRCVAYAFETLGHVAPDVASLRRFIGPPLQDSLAEWLPAAEVDAAVAAYRERFDRVGWRENHVYDGIVDLLVELSGDGHELAVATSKPTVFAERILTHFGLRGYFAQVVGATLGGSLRRKGDLIALALDETTHDAVVVGDRAQDVVGARANGVRSIGVAWGYAEANELQDAGADHIARAPSDVKALLHR
jgi:phosphoglycolate phosphatase